MLKWLKANWKKSMLLLTLGYACHLVFEAFVVTQVLALMGISLPVIV